jgi:hypothetical protein
MRNKEIKQFLNENSESLPIIYNYSKIIRLKNIKRSLKFLPNNYYNTSEMHLSQFHRPISKIIDLSLFV